MANLENCTFENDGVFFTGTETSGDTIQDLTPQVYTADGTQAAVTLPQGVYRRIITANPDYNISASMLTIAGNSANALQQPPDVGFTSFGGNAALLPDPILCWVNEDIFVGVGLGGVGGIPSSVMGGGKIAKVWMKDTVAAGDINNKVEVTIKLMDNFIVEDVDMIINLDIDGDAQVYTPPVFYTTPDVDEKNPFEFLIQPVAFVSFPHRIACKSGHVNQSKQYPQSFAAGFNDLTQPAFGQVNLNNYIDNVNGFNNDVYPQQDGFNYFAKPIIQDNFISATTVSALEQQQIAPLSISQSSLSYAYSSASPYWENQVSNINIETFKTASHNGFAFKNTTTNPPDQSIRMLNKSMLVNDFLDPGTGSGNANPYDKKLTFLLAADPNNSLQADSNFFSVVQVDEITRMQDGSYQTVQNTTNHPFDLNNVALSIVQLTDTDDDSVQSALSVKIPILSSFAIGVDTTFNSFEITEGQYLLYRIYYCLLSSEGEGSPPEL